MCAEAVVGPGHRDMKVRLRLGAMGLPLVTRVSDWGSRSGWQVWSGEKPGARWKETDLSFRTRAFPQLIRKAVTSLIGEVPVHAVPLELSFIVPISMLFSL